ncbi:MAG TPA: hypothetical protein IAD14_09485 [Candidatus Coprousia avicola]|nr:hypothetical protein [Candidatus Coprousia avicola]
MSPIKEEVTSEDFLRHFLIDVYGQTTFSIAKLGCSDLFNTLNDRVLYFDRRLHSTNGLAINETTCSRYLQMADRALSGALNSIDAMEFSSRLATTISSYSGIEGSDISFRYSDTSDMKNRKKTVMLEITRTMMTLFIDKRSVSKASIRMAAKESFQLAVNSIKSGANNLQYGIRQFYFNVTETNYPYKIKAVENNLDIVHFHGLSWTNQNREFLRSALAREDLSVRVALLSPDSPFFTPYADFINVSNDYLKEKTFEVVGIWRSMITSAIESGNRIASFTLVFDRSFPAKSIYRFDDTIVVTPTTNARPKAQFMAYECVSTKEGEQDAFDIYLSEIEWVMKSGDVMLCSSGGRWITR